MFRLLKGLPGVPADAAGDAGGRVERRDPGRGDPARMALSLCHVLGEVTLAAMAAGAEDDPATVRFTLTTGEVVEYDATFHNPFRDLRTG
jgi:hypothetical protein